MDAPLIRAVRSWNGPPTFPPTTRAIMLSSSCTAWGRGPVDFRDQTTVQAFGARPCEHGGLVARKVVLNLFWIKVPHETFIHLPRQPQLGVLDLGVGHRLVDLRLR